LLHYIEVHHHAELRYVELHHLKLRYVEVTYVEVRYVVHIENPSVSYRCRSLHNQVAVQSSLIVRMINRKIETASI
jgi:hypothetical protein